MMSTTAIYPIVFVIRGQLQSTGTAGATRGMAGISPSRQPGQLKSSVRVASGRSTAEAVRVSAVPGEDMVVLHIANGPSLTLHPETARDLMLAQSGIKRGPARGGPPDDGPLEIEVPAQLHWQGLEQAAAARGGQRGFLGEVLLSAVEVIAGPIRKRTADFAASEVVKSVDGQVEAGLYRLAQNALGPLKGNGDPLDLSGDTADGGPMLVLVHGTFVDTASTFGKLWTLYPQLVGKLFAHYGDRVYALDHPTLGESPIANALTLAQALPTGARLHLVTHSRGGLVAEVLTRVCARSDLTANELEDFFTGEAYARQRTDLERLAGLVEERGITVERLVRVACPAHGTLLASKRLDAYVSVLKWALELAGVPVLPTLVDFLGEVALRRADPAMLPGLAAMMPDSPLVNWLQAEEQPIRNQLRVVAGDIEGDSIVSWLKTLLADAFYWTDNDLVVQTRSMYGGTPRVVEDGACFFLDRGGRVSHFNYFANEQTADAIVGALIDERPQGFRAIGPLSWAGEDAEGARAARRSAADPRKPAVFVLPGILGSHLKVGDRRIWLSLRLVGGLERLRYTAGARNVSPDGPIGIIYDDLIEFLDRTHEVIPFAFDWRLPIEQEARRLGAEVDAALKARKASGQPVRLIAHSMGGLVARVMQLECPDIWKRLMDHPDARLLMLGTPNGGSWAPMQVLSGDDTFGNTLAVFGSPFRGYEARQLMAEMPGFIQLQAALLDDRLRLAEESAWQSLAEDDLARIRERSWWHRSEVQLKIYRWGVPTQAVLKHAVELRRRLDQQCDGELPLFRDKLLLVVGQADFTPDGYEMADDGLVYLDAPQDGDGRVTLANALLPGVRTWKLDCAHGDLPNEKKAFEAFLELLTRGDTVWLERQESAARGIRGEAASPSGERLRSRPSRRRFAGATPPETPREVFELPGRDPAAVAPQSAALRVTVVNGNLKFVRPALMVGHYRSSVLTGTEREVDGLIGGAMNGSLGAGLYPEALGSHQVFANRHSNPANPLCMPRPEAVIVVGMGEEGKLRALDLARTVRQGVIAYAQRVAEQDGAPVHFELAATLIGSGGTGITPGNSAQMTAQGVREANKRLADNGWPQVSHLHLIELYLDRATEAWRALQMQAAAAPGLYAVTGFVKPGTGPLMRPLDSGYRGTGYDFITALTGTPEAGGQTIAYTLDTRRARTEVRAQTAQGRLLSELVYRASNDVNQDRRIGRTLFQLLVPLEIEPFLGGTSEMVIELDQGTTVIPWELLDTHDPVRQGDDKLPWAIRCKLLRKLHTQEFREQVRDAGPDDAVLVIGEPLCDDQRYPPLPGARAEAIAVREQLVGPSGIGAEKVLALVSGKDDALTVINTLLERCYRVVHIAGHGEPGRNGGVVLSGGTFLGPNEIQSMRTVPELVFVNCCYLAARDAKQTLQPYDRTLFAANVAEALIRIGVRCVIAAGWAVDDGPAKIFATTFYDRLLDKKQRFMDAVAEARKAAREQGGNTWAAYQCYGDPDWTWSRDVSDAQRPAPSSGDEFDGIASSAALTNALETLTIRSTFQKAEAATQREKIRYLEARFALRWGNQGAVAEAFGTACAAAGDTDRAIEWYEKALTAEDGGTSIRVPEQLGNLRARRAWEQVEAVHGQGNKNVLDKALSAARASLVEALKILDGLVALKPTIERQSLCGSTYKRLAMVERLAGNSKAELSAIDKMALHYGEAEKLAHASHDANLFYPVLNRMAAQLIARHGKAGWPGFLAEDIAMVRQSLERKIQEDPDFWSVAGLPDLEMYRALAAGNLAGCLDTIRAAYEDLHHRMTEEWMWKSVRDQAAFVLYHYPSRGQENPEGRAVAELLDLLNRFAGCCR